MSKHTYPRLVCWDCVEASGKTGAPRPHYTQVEDICDLCKRKNICTPPSDLGHFTPEQLTKVRQVIRNQNLKGNDLVKEASVRKALEIVSSLGESMSPGTKQVYKALEDDLSRGRKLHKYDMQKLMFWFTNDVHLREERKVKIEVVGT